MDFTTVIQMAKQNRNVAKDEGKYYKTKLAPPKKETKESKRLSENIQKFLQKREQEEKEKELEQKKKVASLLSMRDEKSKNKIRKMLKVTKSANKSVLDDADSATQTAISMNGQDQPDQDDYGYVSNEANAFYQKYIEKVKDVKDDKGFSTSRPQSLKDLSGTKERVKAAITREKDEKLNGVRRSHKPHTETATILPTSASSTKTLYDPAAKRQEEEKKREEERKKAKSRRPLPPAMDFLELLKLAEKKQHEPIEIIKEVKKEPERLLTLKEKREQEELKRFREAREQRDRDRKEGRTSSLSTASNSSKSSASSSGKSSAVALKTTNTSKLDNNQRGLKKVSSSVVSPLRIAGPSTKSLNPIQTPAVNTKMNNASKANPKPNSSVSVRNHSLVAKPYDRPTKELPPKPSYNGPTREFPPRENKVAVKGREAPKIRQLPIPDVRRGGSTGSKITNKRRILDDDDEYDSEMDDFIDDGDDEQDYSSVIKDIFGYDKSKYRDYDDDDAAMESNFAQVQREEFMSKKMGMQEDLEDMRLEAIEKERKRKIMKRSR